MFSKIGKYFLCFVLFIFVMTITADAFTAIRQEDLGGDKPMTRAQKKAHQRRLKEHPEDESLENSSFSNSRTSTIIKNSNNGSSSGSGSSGHFVRPSGTTTPTPTVDRKAEQEKREKARKTSNTIFFLFVLLVIGGLAGWYFTRNVNFKKLKK